MNLLEFVYGRETNNLNIVISPFPVLQEGVGVGVIGSACYLGCDLLINENK